MLCISRRINATTSQYAAECELHETWVMKLSYTVKVLRNGVSLTLRPATEFLTTYAGYWEGEEKG